LPTPGPCPYKVRMTGKPKGGLRVRWLWKWIARERKGRGISRSEFARRIGIHPETLHMIESRRGDSDASTLIDALAELGALGAVAEMDGMDWHAAALSLTKDECAQYDAIAERDGLTRAEVIRQLAAEGERLVMTVDRDQPDLSGKLATVLRKSGAPAPDTED